MCEVLKFTNSLSKDDFCPFQCNCDEIDIQKPGVGEPVDPIDGTPGDPIDGDIDIEIDIKDEQCGDVFYCIRKISSYSPTIGDKWKAFMNCIEKIKGLPPIGDSDSCEGCPKFKHRGPVVTTLDIERKHRKKKIL